MEQPLPEWITALDEEDWQFLKRFLFASGSLKALADEYGISYPTVRNRLDRLIAKAQAADQPGADDGFHRRLRVLVAEGRLEAATARQLLGLHRQSMASRR